MSASFSPFSRPIYTINKQPHPFLPLLSDHEEYRYLELLTTIMSKGSSSDDRTGVGTLRIVAPQLRFSLSNENGEKVLPLFTTKKMYWKGILEELCWFIAGRTDCEYLSSRGVRIWEGNSSREFLDKNNLQDYQDGDCGPIYGFQWRHWGADYQGKDVDYTGQGIDQLKEVIEQIKSNPESRRHLVVAWDPRAVKKTPLPPCHYAFQFIVEEKKFLSCVVTMRSCDAGLGLPFNIASYSLLTHIVAQLTGLQGKEIILNPADTHVYITHVPQLEKQAELDPYPFPTIQFVKPFSSIDEFTNDSVELLNYVSHPPIKMEMAV